MNLMPQIPAPALPLTEAAVVCREQLYGMAAAFASHIEAHEGIAVVDSLMQKYDQACARLAEEQRQRWEREGEELRVFRLAEREALPPGTAWTKYRPFFNNAERVGAMKCGNIYGSRKGSCNKPTAYVSYCGLGRVAICEACYTRQESSKLK